MNLKGKTIGFGITGSFCTFSKIKPVIEQLVQSDANVIPIFSYNAYSTDTRFGKARDFVEYTENTTHNQAIHSITEAEKFGPNDILDILVIAPCTGNTLAKMTTGITDTPVLMAAKGHVRTGKPLVVSISTNDALGANFKNIGALYHYKNIFFVPFNQDNPKNKPFSIIADTKLIIPTLENALDKVQIQPLMPVE